MFAISDQRAPVVPVEESTGSNYRVFVACLLSAIVPGAGQIALGARRRGFLFLCTAGALLILSWLATQPATLFDLARLAVQPHYLAAAFAVNLLLLGLRLAAVIDTWRLGQVRGGQRVAASHLAMLLLGGLLIFTAVPHLAAGYYDLQTWRLLDGLFGQQRTEEMGAPGEPFQTTREIHLAGDEPVEAGVAPGSDDEQP